MVAFFGGLAIADQGETLDEILGHLLAFFVDPA
jgi:hypothetical protein